MRSLRKSPLAAIAAATGAYTATVAENVSGGSLNVPVTVSHLPDSSVTFNVEVLSTGTTTEGDDYTIATKSVTFGPDSAKTQNIAVSIIHDRPTDNGETIQLRIVAADSPVDDLGDHYARHASGATATITLTDVAQSSDAILSALVINTSSDNSDFSGTLDFDFMLDTVGSFSINVENTVAYIKLTPTVREPNATVEIGETGGSLTPIDSGSQSDEFALAVGERINLEIKVTAQDGTIAKYFLTLTREVSADVTLSALSGVTSKDGSVFGDLLTVEGPLPADHRTNYRAFAPISATHVKLTPTVNRSEATVKVGKGSSLADVTSGTTSAALSLDRQPTDINIEVTAPDGTTKKTYVVAVRRQGICDRTEQGARCDHGSGRRH